MFIIDKGLEIGVGAACAVAEIEGDESYKNFQQWYYANSYRIFIASTISRHIGYWLRNLSYLINIASWLIVIETRKTSENLLHF
jgi:hypothetical protein